MGTFVLYFRHQHAESDLPSLRTNLHCPGSGVEDDYPGILDGTGKRWMSVCVDDIVKAVEDCQDEDVNILTCITEAVGAASDCAHCICEILEHIIDVSDICP